MIQPAKASRPLLPDFFKKIEGTRTNGQRIAQKCPPRPGEPLNIVKPMNQKLKSAFY